MKEIWDTQTNEQLCAEYQQTNDNELFEYFLSRNYGLIKKYLKPIITKHPEKADELIQQCKIAMWEAMKNFDCSQEYNFSTYVYIYFKKNAWHNYHEQYLIHIPINLINHLDEVKEKLPFAVLEADSLDRLLCPNSEDGEEVTLGDKVASSDPTPLDVILKEDDSNYIINLAKRVLSPKQFRCIEEYYGINGQDSRTLQKIGDEFGVSRERIRQVIEKGLLKLRKAYLKEKDKYEN